MKWRSYIPAAAFEGWVIEGTGCNAALSAREAQTVYYMLLYIVPIPRILHRSALFYFRVSMLTYLYVHVGTCSYSPI
jgi:hypothetical protein